MKSVQAQALVRDALYQVLDNQVFRILAGLALVPALFTFLVAFHEEEIVVLFGWSRIPYDSLSWLIPAGVSEAKELAIESFLSLVFDHLTGTFGVIVCLVATVFFVPQMIEKGAADVLFHKPLTRFTFYIARYFSGLLFVGLLAVAMTTGIFLGLSLFSSHNDPGILLSAATLIYGFALLYAVSMLFGLWMKNAVGALLCTLILMFFNGCVVHSAWTFKQWWRMDGAGVLQVRDQASDEAAPDESAPIDTLSGDVDPLDTLGPFWRSAAYAADVLHYTLPKTNDVALIGRELRRRANRLPYQDRESGVSIFSLPSGSQLLSPASVEPPRAVQEEMGPARFALSFPRLDSSFSLHRRERRQSAEDPNESARDAAEALRDTIAASRPGSRPERNFGTLGTSSRGQSFSATFLRWSREGERRSTVLVVRAGDWIYALHFDLPTADAASVEEELRRAIDPCFGLWEDDRSGFRPPWTMWYQANVGFGGPLPLNLGFSILTSLAFVVLVLLLGWWRLARMDF